MERTLVLIKPDAVQRALVGEILSRFEKKGFRIIGMKMIRLNDEILAEHYSHLSAKPFFKRIKDFMKSAPVIALCLEGKDCTEIVRKVCGVTNSRIADTGTIRGDLGMSVQCNLVHASDSKDKAIKEIKTFFQDSELFNYENPGINFVYSTDELASVS